MRIAYLGPAGSYTHEAAIKHFGNTHTFNFARTIDSAFKKVISDVADCAVVPVENSTYGAVDITLDNLINSNLSIDGEVLLPVRHALLSTQTSLDDIDTVYAHPQAFAQCRRWLEQCLPQARLIESTSNSAGAISAGTHERSAAIASAAAAELYNLNVLATAIQDIDDNVTRFLVIAPPSDVETLLENTIEPVSGWATSLLLSADNRPGALFRLIKPLADHGVSMTRIESRPSRRAAWDYFFILDIEGRRTDESVQAALTLIEKESSLFRVLGSYPKAVI